MAGSIRFDQRVAVAGDCTVYRDSVVSMNRVSLPLVGSSTALPGVRSVQVAGWLVASATHRVVAWGTWRPSSQV